MNVQQEEIHAILMQHVRTILVHILVNAIVDLVEMEQLAQMQMNVQQEDIHVILMQHVRTMLVHIPVSAIVDLVEMEQLVQI